MSRKSSCREYKLFLFQQYCCPTCKESKLTVQVTEGLCVDGEALLDGTELVITDFMVRPLVVLSG